MGRQTGLALAQPALGGVFGFRLEPGLGPGRFRSDLRFKPTSCTAVLLAPNCATTWPRTPTIALWNAHFAATNLSRAVPQAAFSLTKSSLAVVSAASTASSLDS